MKSPNPATGISAAPQTLPQVIKKPQKFMGQFNLHFCWVEHCPRARSSPWEGLLKVSLAGGYFPVVSELCGNCKNIEKYCSSTSVFCGCHIDSYPVLGGDYHREVVTHSRICLHFWTLKENSTKKPRRK